MYKTMCYKPFIFIQVLTEDKLSVIIHVNEDLFETGLILRD